ncbi:MAG: malto-oligosyltrehalose synthase [Ilumatobacteraceae bacterium]
MPPTRPEPTATYRFQLTPTFGFDRVVTQLERLVALGVSHIYLSPVAEAVPGSTHGYDVVDHTRVRDELGGLDGLTKLLDAVDARGLGLLVDHVPNHSAAGQAELNRPWWSMLRDGPGSDGACWFDVDWDAGDGRVILPFLGEPLDDVVGRLERRDGELRLDGQRWPLAPDTAGLPMDELLDRQHYRLQWWRQPERNVRRFFTIDDLVAVRVEDPQVAAVVDTIPRLLAAHPAFAGVRVDHIDGLADPQGYLDGLAATIGHRWLVVEKILAAGERLPDGWPVDGTTGYEHAAVLEQAMLDTAGWARLRARWSQAVGDDRPFRAWELDARREVLDRGLRPDLDRVARVATRPGGDAATLAAARATIELLSVHLRRYRTYLPTGADALQAARAEAVAADPSAASSIDALVAQLGEPGELVTRWQQLTGPATAKGVEDRAFWRYVPLASLGEVGGEPEPPPDAVVDLHELHVAAQSRWPTTLLAGTTHDTARSEDIRANGLALAASPDGWLELYDEVTTSSGGGRPALDPAMTWMALQTVATTPELDAGRLGAFLVKAAREADVRSSWAEPDEAYEAALGALAADLVAWPPAQRLGADLAAAGRAVTLAMLAVRTTAPGVPDLYQGTEALRYVLVDPDNRTEPEWTALDDLVTRARSLDGPAAWSEPGAPAARAVVIHRVMAARRDLALAGYVPVTASSGLLAFARLDPGGAPVLVTVVGRALAAAPHGAVELPGGPWRSLLDDAAPVVEGILDAGAALRSFPAVVLVRA